jgi:glycosyltransferase involved in cell wall biosynthesis
VSTRILHILSQRPSLTGSGVTLDVLVRHGADSGYDQRVVVGTPASDPHPQVGGLDSSLLHPLHFETPALPFPVPGMSDVMPYPSTVWSAMNSEQLAVYKKAWQAHLKAVTRDFQPDLIHCHHAWLLGSMMKRLFPNTPVVIHSHATGLRQMTLCPKLWPQIKDGLRQNDAFCVLHKEHAADLRAALEVPEHQVHLVGAGYREDLFHASGRYAAEGSLVYAGKYSNAKGLPQLLDAVEQLAVLHPKVVLHVAGDGAGKEAEALRHRMAQMGKLVVMHGMLNQEQLSALLRRCQLLVLPSFYEGLPLVLVEALACGCRLVCSDLPGVRQELAPHLGDALDRVKLPQLIGPDTPEPSQLPAFVDRLTNSLDAALNKPPLADPKETMPHALNHFGWHSTWQRVERIWQSLLKGIGD